MPNGVEGRVASAPAGPPAGTGSGDPTWKALYRTGGIAAFVYVLSGLVVPALLFIPQRYERGMDGDTLLQFIADHRLWWIVLQTLVLGLPSFVAIVFFVALFVSLLPASKSLALMGASIVLTVFVLFIAYYPVTLGIVYLSDLYTTSGPERQASLAAAGEGLIAVIDAFNPLYESVLAVGVLCYALAMLKGVYPRGVAYLGLATAAAVPVALSLWPLVGIGYFWWWLLFVAWFLATGWHLYRLGSDGGQGTAVRSQRDAGVTATDA